MVIFAIIPKNIPYSISFYFISQLIHRQSVFNIIFLLLILFLGLGNYDINVLTAALQTKDYSIVWFDKRKDPSCICIGKIIVHLEKDHGCLGRLNYLIFYLFM